MAEWETQLRNARLEVVVETSHGRRQIPGVCRCNVVAQQARQCWRGRLVRRRGADFELRPDVLRHPRFREGRLLLCRFLILCARQRWRIERGKHSSIARIMPGAPSLATKSGSGRPRRRISWRNSRQLAVSSLVPGARCKSAFLPSRRMPHAANTDIGTSPAATDPFGGRLLTGHPEKQIDYAARSTNLMTVRSKQIIKAFYADRPKYSYFFGCSTGGGQGVHESLQFPGDYDGIVALAPGMNLTHQRQPVE
jgi:hypothetical protein